MINLHKRKSSISASSQTRSSLRKRSRSYWTTKRQVAGSCREINFTVTVNGRHFPVSSASKDLFFLSWNGPDDERGGFNCRMSRALAAILPEDFYNRKSLVPTVERFRWSIIDRVLPIIEKRW